jgi:hypothetical protein
MPPHSITYQSAIVVTLVSGAGHRLSCVRGGGTVGCQLRHRDRVEAAKTYLGEQGSSGKQDFPSAEVPSPCFSDFMCKNSNSKMYRETYSFKKCFYYCIIVVWGISL